MRLDRTFGQCAMISHIYRYKLWAFQSRVGMKAKDQLLRRSCIKTSRENMVPSEQRHTGPEERVQYPRPHYQRLAIIIKQYKERFL